MTKSSRLSLQQCVSLACLLDVTTPKPGNVHRGADFEDTTFLDFVLSATAIAPVIANVDARNIGSTILDAIRATRRVTNANTNLGIVLLMVPLAALARSGRGATCARMKMLLNDLHARDAQCVYEAIRLAKPGGLGDVERNDVHAEEVPASLLEAMASAAERDTIAREYVSGFALTIETLAPRLSKSVAQHGVVMGILDTFVWILATEEDSLIRRKCGPHVASEAALGAMNVLDAGPPDSESYCKSLSELDFWLRSDGNRRNPGTSADLVTAAVFLCLWDSRIDFDLVSQFR